MTDKNEVDQFKKRRLSASTSWQSEAWEYYDAIPEVKFAFNLVANIVSRIRLYAAAIEDPAETPVPVNQAKSVDERLSGAAARALELLDSAYGGQAGLLRDATLNMSVAGECYLIQVPERLGSKRPESWDIRSVDELQVNSQGKFCIVPRRELLSSNGGAASMAQQNGVIILPDKAFMARIWRPHARFSDEADSSLRSSLDLMGELLLINRTFRATARSRLNAGALYIPDGLSTAVSGDPDYPFDSSAIDPYVTPDEAEDAFEESLLDAMTTPIEDESSAAAVVPLIIRGPADLGDKIKQFKFERAFDEVHLKRAEQVLARILGGLDLPKDVVTGLSGVKYSNAAQIDETLYKAHIEPMVVLLTDAITVSYLRPYLRSLGFSEADANRICIWYDPSSISTRNDRAGDADTGLTNGAVSWDTWRRAHGFSDADAPTPNELVIKMLNDKGTLQPELTEALLTALAPDIMNQAKLASQASSVAPIPGDVSSMLNGGAPAAAPAGDAPAPADKPEEKKPEAPKPDAPKPEAPKPPAAEEKKPAAPANPAGPPIPLAEPK